MPPQAAFDNSEEEDPFNIRIPDSLSPSSKLNNGPSKIPIMKNSNLRSSLENIEESASSSFSLNDSPRLMEAMRQITRNETPVKRFQTQPSQMVLPNADLFETPKKGERAYNHGFVVTPFDSRIKSSSIGATQPESPSNEELMKKLTATREQFNQDISTNIQARISPKLLSKTLFDDSWKELSSFPKLSFNEKPNQNLIPSSKATARFNDDPEFETESNHSNLYQNQYEDSRTRLDRIRQRSKEILSTKSSTWNSQKEYKGGFFPRRSSLIFYCVMVFLASTFIYFMFFGDQMVLNFLL